MKQNYFMIMLFISGLAMITGLSTGCGLRLFRPLPDERNPSRLYTQGMELIEKGDNFEARQHFERAIDLDSGHPDALAGMALITALQVASQADTEIRDVQRHRAIELMKKASSKARTKSEKFSVAVTGIRVFTHLRTEDWLDRAIDFYKQAATINDIGPKEFVYYASKEAASYFMGEAYFRAYRFGDSKDVLADLLGATSGKWYGPGHQLYARARKLSHTSGGFILEDVANAIAIKGQTDRADLAALLIDELSMDKFFARHKPEGESFAATEMDSIEVPADISKHPFRPEIITVISWNLTGLKPAQDATDKKYLFYPDSPITRGELAYVLEQLLVRISGDESLTNKFTGQDESPHPDVALTEPWYNAIMVCVNRELIEPDLSGEFRPNDIVTGAELLLSVMRLRNIMYLY